VVYSLQELDGDDNLFSITTVNGKGIIRLVGQLDYERKFLYQLRVMAVDRSNNERVSYTVLLERFCCEVHVQFLCLDLITLVYFFLCHLFYDTFNISHYIASKFTINPLNWSEKRINKRKGSYMVT
jgi:hypothetical protein